MGLRGAKPARNAVLITIFWADLPFGRACAVLSGCSCGASQAIEINLTTQKLKSRMISVRVSEEEYSALRVLCTLTGARSVSALTRDAMRTLMDGVNRDEALGGHMDDFRAHIRKLNKNIEKLSHSITTFKVDSSR
jgi:hypothetical protein